MNKIKLMSDINGNPLKEIFKQSKKGEIIEEIKSIDKIPLFFKYIKDENIPSESRSKIIEDLIKKLKKIATYVNIFLPSKMNQYI